MHALCRLLLILLAVQVNPASAFESWIEQRDRGVVRQQRDFSCGLATLATLLTHVYADPTSEDELLRQLASLAPAGRAAMSAGVSFADLALLAAERGYLAQGYAVAQRQLHGFKVPVLVNLQVGGRSHFSLLRGVSDSGQVWLADPSWGNRRLPAWEFQRLFQSDEGSEHGGSEHGRVLLVVPRASGSRIDVDSVDPGVEAPVQISPVLR